MDPSLPCQTASLTVIPAEQGVPDGMEGLFAAHHRQHHVGVSPVPEVVGV